MTVDDLHRDMTSRFDRADRDRRELGQKVDKGLREITEVRTRLEEKSEAAAKEHKEYDRRIAAVEERQGKAEDRGSSRLWSLILAFVSAALGAGCGALVAKAAS